ncbi:MAG: FHA domain-containing protein [Chloroflexi bacterium]|nr:FHA domain-containing protein [Chloroflexota bacterium]
MVICPKCHTEQPDGALFCNECGAQLVSLDAFEFKTLNSEDSPELFTSPLTDLPDVELEDDISMMAQSEVSLLLLDSGKMIHLSGKREFSLGRVAEGQLILPDIDLSPFDAYAQGVSRLHASIKISPRIVILSDLGSSNGTRVNGQRIGPHIDYPINHGDLVALGKLRIKILIDQKE